MDSAVSPATGVTVGAAGGGAGGGAQPAASRMNKTIVTNSAPIGAQLSFITYQTKGSFPRMEPVPVLDTRPRS